MPLLGIPGSATAMSTYEIMFQLMLFSNSFCESFSLADPRGGARDAPNGVQVLSF